MSFYRYGFESEDGFKFSLVLPVNSDIWYEFRKQVSYGTGWRLVTIVHVG